MLIRHLRARRADVTRLVIWSLVQALPTLASGWSMAEAVRRFQSGHAATGLAWLGLLGLAMGTGALGARQVSLAAGAIAEPLRDDLVTTIVTGALARSTEGVAATPDTRSIARLTHQAEIIRDSCAGLLIVACQFACSVGAAIIGLVTLVPSAVVYTLPPVLVSIVLLRLLLPATVARQRAAVLAEEDISEGASRAVAGLRDVTACGAEDLVLDDLTYQITRQASIASSAAAIGSARVLCLAIGGWAPLVLMLAAVPGMLGHGVTAATLIGALAYITGAMRGALSAVATGMGTGLVRLTVTLERIRQTAAPDYFLDPAEAHGTGDAEETEEATGTRTPIRTRVARTVHVNNAVHLNNAVHVNNAVHATSTAHVNNTAHQDNRVAQGTRAGAGHIELRDVRFAYGPDAVPVIDGLSLRIPPGDHLGVVGPSGIGKSSLAALIAGLLHPSAGEVLLNGTPTADCGQLWRVVIPQEAYVFAGTLEENLTYFRRASRRALDTAAEEVGLVPVLSRLGGYDAHIRPAALSAGERQLIALTRSYLSPAPVAILDEATCHLDPAAEEQAEKAFAHRDGTLIVVAHRITSARRAKRILVLDGVVARIGSHEQLLTASPMYRDLSGYWTANAR
jgi:ATP-binding cassette subfamily C protein